MTLVSSCLPKGHRTRSILNRIDFGQSVQHAQHSEWSPHSIQTGPGTCNQSHVRPVFWFGKLFFSAQKLVWTQITGFGRLRRSHVSISVFCILAYERSSTVVIRQSLPVSAFRHFADSHPKISPRSILNPFCCKSRPPPFLQIAGYLS